MNQDQLQNLSALFDGLQAENVSSSNASLPFVALEAESFVANQQDPMEAVRTERNRLLTLSDWTQMPDAALSNAQKDKWLNYRRQLRDLSLQIHDPSNVIWPVRPSNF